MRTCLADVAAPSVSAAARSVLERAGVTVGIPRGQTCCGQPGWSAGHHDEARVVARQALRAFAGDDPVVVPSGSCAAMIVHGYPELFEGRPEEDEARHMAARTREFSQFLAENDLLPGGSRGGSATYHDSCHMLRILGEKESPRAALAAGGVEIREMEQADVCCGFGGMFAVTYPEVSGSLGEQKARNAAAAGADELVACDLSCLLHITGRAHRLGIPLRARHLAEVLAP